MAYVVFELNGRQYDGFIGQKITVDLLSSPDKNIKIDKVLLCKNSDDQILIGKPFVNGAEITAEPRENFKDTKVIVYKYKKRKNFRKKIGHRQQYSMIFLNSLKTPEFSIDAAAIEEARKKEAQKWHDINMKKKAERKKDSPPAETAQAPGHATPAKGHKKQSA